VSGGKGETGKRKSGKGETGKGDAKERSELLQGTLDLLILKTLGLGPRHGLGIARRIEQVTEGTFAPQPGSLFPALYRLEEQGWLESEWGESENRRRAKFYRLTRAGRRQLEAETEQWERVATAIARALAATS
jgi:PadR family transcriptional regulator PadR